MPDGRNYHVGGCGRNDRAAPLRAATAVLRDRLSRCEAPANRLVYSRAWTFPRTAHPGSVQDARRRRTAACMRAFPALLPLDIDEHRSTVSPSS